MNSPSVRRIWPSRIHPGLIRWQPEQARWVRQPWDAVTSKAAG